MIAFKDCENPSFVSYAHRDDTSQFGWWESLRNAIFQRLDRLDNEIPKLGLHFSQENGPAAARWGQS